MPVNPYRKKAYEFPARIFNFGDFDDDCESVAAIACGKDVFCEIGSGSGAHLLELGRRSPEAVFFGFERRFKRAVRTVEKAERDGIENIYVLRTDAMQLNRIFSNRTFCGIYVNFPDPWAKSKQLKHRILTAAFLDTCHLRLEKRGFLSVKTDSHDYFSAFLHDASSDTRFALIESTRDLHRSHYVEHNIITEFENLFISKNQAICYAKLASVS